MKQIFRCIALCTFLFCIKNVFAISSEFEYMIKEIGVPRYNVKNQEINEEIYEVYNIFIYGSPTTVNNKEQRWKGFATGKWTKNASKYIGKGERGEYAVLGYDYSSNIVYNYYFPLDRVTSTPVVNWTFLNVKGATESWTNAEKYYTKEQIEYMKEAKWWFQNITGGKNDPYDQMEYDLSVNQVGMSKAKLETPATWKSKGSIYTERRTESGGIGWANFAIQPMSANARVESKLQMVSEVILDENTDEILIPIEYGAKLKDLSKYAKATHVKEIKTVLKLEDKLVAEISGSKITSVGNKYMLVISREKFLSGNNNEEKYLEYKVKATVESFVKTEFSADGILKDTTSFELFIKIEPKKITPIQKSGLNILMKSNNDLVVSPLAQTIETNKSESVGFCEAGRYLLIISEIDESNFNIQDFKNISIYINNEKIKEVEVLNSEGATLNVAFKVPDETKTTLYGIKSLREKTGNYFTVSSLDILSRKNQPHKLEMKYNIHGVSQSELIYFDTVDDIYSNMNLNITDKLYVTKLDNKEFFSKIQ